MTRQLMPDGVSFLLLGLVLGLVLSLVPNIGQRIHWVIAVVILLSFMPTVIEGLRARSRRAVRAAASPAVLARIGPPYEGRSAGVERVS
jgi:hypothetical protein